MYYKELDTNYPVPKNATYYRNPKALDLFMKIDHPRSFNDISDLAQDRLLAWCGKLPRIKSINYWKSSYMLKHVFESQTGIYVTNGAFKGAMLLCGFKVANTRLVNWHFNVSERSIKTS